MQTKSEIVNINRGPELEYDADLLISLGQDRFDTKWKSTKIRWSALVGRLASSKKTEETHAEFMRMTKDDQDRIKDIGGFVGGHLTGGRRIKKNAASRQIVTLDADYAPRDFWSRVEDLTLDGLDCACLVYSTHKHTDRNPRLRLVIPLSHEVGPEEYEAIARKLAESIGIDYFDDTTYETNRLMFWPSHSSDVAPAFKLHDAPFLEPEEVLKRYRDWTDAAEWPYSSRAKEARRKKAEQVEDPLTKKGIVGVFCRTYSITEAIRKFLPDVYIPTDKDDRWTYAAGSTHGGLVVYDNDTLAFSHHSTDPVSGLDVNAFDLVRLHRFGELDQDIESSVPVNKRPSWAAMHELMSSDPECIRTKDSEAAEDFKDTGDWQTKLDRKKDLSPQPSLLNAVLILQHDERMESLSFNELEGLINAEDMPWDRPKVPWREADDAQLATWLSMTYGVEFPAVRLRQALVAVADSRRFHPVKRYLEGLPPWDGVKRIDTLLTDCLQAEDNEYSREAIRKTLVAAVARVYRPGIKFDTMLVLVGPQGAGKSTLFSVLARDWFSDSLKMDMMNKIKDAGEQLQGRWIVEIGEMSGMKKADVEAVKSFVSRQSDNYRAAFGHYTESRPRRCIIVGSTNNEEGFLRDVTGNRRFWPVLVKSGGFDQVNKVRSLDVDQIWAEAKALYDKGESLLLSEEADKLAGEAQREAMEQDDRQGLVEEYLDKLLPEGWDDMDPELREIFIQGSEPGTVQRTEVSNMEIWVEALHGSGVRMEPKDSYAIAKIMAKIQGWKKTNIRKRVGAYGLQRIYRRVCDK